MHKSNREIQKHSTEYNYKEKTVHILSGIIAGVTNVLVGHPLDTVKIRMQMTHKSFAESSKIIMGKEGITALYKGITTPLIMVPFGKTLVFFAYEFALKHLGVENTPDLHVNYTILGGFFAGYVVTFLATPSELIKCRQQMEGVGVRIQRTGVLELTRKIVAVEGLRTLYSGYTMTFLRDVPSYGVYFGTFQETRKYLNEQIGESWVSTFLAGSTAGITSWIAAYPFDVVKTKVQNRQGGNMEVIRKIWKHDGMKGFFRGITPCLSRAPIVSGFTLWPYEASKKFFSKHIH